MTVRIVIDNFHFLCPNELFLKIKNANIENLLNAEITNELINYHYHEYPPNISGRSRSLLCKISYMINNESLFNCLREKSKSKITTINNLIENEQTKLTQKQLNVLTYGCDEEIEKLWFEIKQTECAYLIKLTIAEIILFVYFYLLSYFNRVCVDTKENIRKKIYDNLEMFSYTLTNILFPVYPLMQIITTLIITQKP